MSNDLKLYQNLFSIYSPLETNNALLLRYREVRNDETNIKNVRYKINKLITENYLNETVIKAFFIKNVLSKRSPRQNITIFELNAGTSRADLCVMNGASTAYEIKTEYDSFYRLDKQINDYTNLFEFINIIVPVTDVNKIKARVADFVGIISYKQTRYNNITFKTEKIATLNRNIKSALQLNSLTKSELLRFAKHHNNKVTREHLIDELSSRYTAKQLNNYYIQAIKAKYFDKWNFLHENLNDIYLLDYQWFFKNPLKMEKVYI